MKAFSIIFLIWIFGCNSDGKYPTIVYPEGGYDLPKHVEDKDTSFFCYPIKSLESSRDSMNDSFWGHKLLSAYNEPNISIRPLKKPIFRFSYEPSTSPAYIITLTEGSIIIKKGSRTNYLNVDRTKLTELENLHYDILENNYPIIKNNKEGKKRYRQHYLDSVIKVYPQLLDPAYFPSLLNKTIIPNETPFTYTTRKISISRFDYNKLVDLINTSGYWKLPINNRCGNPPNDGFSFTLEANNGEKYNIVKSGSCLDESTNFTKACQELLKYARVADEIWVDTSDRNKK